MAYQSFHFDKETETKKSGMWKKGDDYPMWVAGVPYGTYAIQRPSKVTSPKVKYKYK